jgi:alpha-D-ribose 1-methylphosphonate 5-triphosphate synthase subunit PhnI
MPLAVDRVMGEGGLYAPELAAAALRQSGGDTLEAAFLVRAYRSSVPRIGSSDLVDPNRMRVERRISAAFKEIPGGQLLGATPDYTHRLIRLDLLENPLEARESLSRAFEQLMREGEPVPDAFPKVVTMLQEQGLLPSVTPKETQPVDVTVDSLEFPAPRSARLQLLARSETGGILALAYASMRGYGQIHPVVGELRVGEVPIRFQGHLVGWARVTECEVIARMDAPSPSELPQFTLGYGLCFGHNEVKAISMAILDRALMSPDPENPTQDQEFVLLHTDGVESSGFCLHYKLPHYVTFQADLSQIREVRGDPQRGSAHG